MMMQIIKKAIGMCLIGLGIGILLVLFLPLSGWLFIIGVAIAVVGFLWLKC